MLDAHCEESSTDDIDTVNKENYVIFVGDNIIIGRSNLRKENTSTAKKVSLECYDLISLNVYLPLFKYLTIISYFITYMIKLRFLSLLKVYTFKPTSFYLNYYSI